MKTLVWTRSESDWVADQALVAGLPGGTQLLRLPCVRLVAKPVDTKRASYDYVVVTSAHAVDFALADQKLAAALRAARLIYTHGAATAARLREHGLPCELVESARTAAELGETLAQALPAGAAVLLPTAAEPAFDLAASLQARGYAAEAVACYATAAEAREADGRELSAARVAELQRTLAGVVCFASPSAVAGFARALAPRANALAGALRAVAIGPTTAAAAESEFEAVITVEENSLVALVRGALAALCL